VLSTLLATWSVALNKTWLLSSKVYDRVRKQEELTPTLPKTGITWLQGGQWYRCMHLNLNVSTPKLTPTSAFQMPGNI
jgi:hypothetical protein